MDEVKGTEENDNISDEGDDHGQDRMDTKKTEKISPAKMEHML
jgi:hypothetical protein